MLEEIKERLKRITYQRGNVAYKQKQKLNLDKWVSDFYDHAPADIRYLIELVEQQQKEIDEILKLIDQLQPNDKTPVAGTMVRLTPLVGLYECRNRYKIERGLT